MSQRRVSCVPALPFWIDLIVLLLLRLHLHYQRLLQACYCPWVFGSSAASYGGNAPLPWGPQNKGENGILKNGYRQPAPPAPLHLPYERVHLRRQKSRLDVPCTASSCGSQNQPLLRFVTLPVPNLSQPYGEIAGHGAAGF